MSKDLIFQQTGKDDWYKIWHTSETNLFLYVHSGDGNMVTREKSHPLEEGMLYFIGSEKYHYTFPEHIDGYVRSKLHFSAADLSRIRQLFPEGSPLNEIFVPSALAVATVPPTERETVETLLHAFERADEEAPTYPAEHVSAILRLMSILAKNLTATTPNLAGPMQKAVDYINHHITEDISIEDLCSAAYLSKYHFCRLFKQKTGLTAMEYILKTRIVMAKEMLSKKERSISEISDACGFSSLSYFCRVFKADTGLSPLQYKKSV